VAKGSFSSIGAKLREAIDIEQLIELQANALRDIILDPKKNKALNPVDTIDAIAENAKKNVELLEEALHELAAG
jgi:hypothetical protein